MVGIMAKEIPYFRFTAQEWQNGNVSLESYELKGLFVDVCAYYWVRDCSITRAMLEKKFSNDKELLKQLINLDIIQEENGDGFVKITFLDVQFDMLSERRLRRQQAGSIGGKKKSSNAKAKLKQSSSYKDKDKDNNKDKEKIKEVKESALPYFKEWMAYRKAINKPMVVYSTINRLVNRFNSETTDKIEWVVNHSIENNYQGLFWDKFPKTVSSNRGTRRQGVVLTEEQKEQYR